jgi:hypothetical protein
MLEARCGGVKVMPGTAAIGVMVPYWHKILTCSASGWVQGEQISGTLYWLEHWIDINAQDYILCSIVGVLLRLTSWSDL